MRNLLLAALLFALVAWAADVAGRWWGEVVTAEGSQPVYVTLVQEGQTLRGSGGPAPMEQSLLTNGKIEGNRVSFDILPGRRSPLHFELVSDGEWLRGTVKLRLNGQPVTGKVSLRKRTT